MIINVTATFHRLDSNFPDEGAALHSLMLKYTKTDMASVKLTRNATVILLNIMKSALTAKIGSN